MSNFKLFLWFLWSSPRLYVTMVGWEYVFHANRTDDGDPVDEGCAVTLAEMVAYDAARFAAGCAAVCWASTLLGFWSAFIFSPWALVVPALTFVFLAVFADVRHVTASGGFFHQAVVAYRRV